MNSDHLTSDCVVCVSAAGASALPGGASKSNRISGGAANGTPTCPSCPHLLRDKKYPGWGWCDHPQNRVFGMGWVNGFTPSQSPSGSCELHPERAVAAEKSAVTDGAEQTTKSDAK